MQVGRVHAPVNSSTTHAHVNPLSAPAQPTEDGAGGADRAA
jgi:hypothetical protein